MIDLCIFAFEKYIRKSRILSYRLGSGSIANFVLRPSGQVPRVVVEVDETPRQFGMIHKQTEKGFAFDAHDWRSLLSFAQAPHGSPFSDRAYIGLNYDAKTQSVAFTDHDIGPFDLPLSDVLEIEQIRQSLTGAGG